MSTIGPAELAAYLRGQLGVLRKTAAITRPAGGASGPQPSRTTEQGGSGQDGSRSSRADMAATLAAKVRALDQTDPDRRRKAFKMFLESVLLEEWGQQLINDPGFYQLVDSVQAQMEASEELRGPMAQAADHLLAQGGRR